MTAAIVGMTTFGWVTQQFGERMSVMGIGIVLLATAALVVTSQQWIVSLKK
jgi:MFS transporter, DHA3 family, macrolide efflux protein